MEDDDIVLGDDDVVDSVLETGSRLRKLSAVKKEAEAPTAPPPRKKGFAEKLLRAGVCAPDIEVAARKRKHNGDGEPDAKAEKPADVEATAKPKKPVAKVRSDFFDPSLSDADRALMAVPDPEEDDVSVSSDEDEDALDKPTDADIQWQKTHIRADDDEILQEQVEATAHLVRTADFKEAAEDDVDGNVSGFLASAAKNFADSKEGIVSGIEELQRYSVKSRKHPLKTIKRHLGKCRAHDITALAEFIVLRYHRANPPSKGDGLELFQDAVDARQTLINMSAEACKYSLAGRGVPGQIQAWVKRFMPLSTYVTEVLEFSYPRGAPADRERNLEQLCSSFYSAIITDIPHHGLFGGELINQNTDAYCLKARGGLKFFVASAECFLIACDLAAVFLSPLLMKSILLMAISDAELSDKKLRKTDKVVEMLLKNDRVVELLNNIISGTARVKQQKALLDAAIALSTPKNKIIA